MARAFTNTHPITITNMVAYNGTTTANTYPTHPITNMVAYNDTTAANTHPTHPITNMVAYNDTTTTNTHPTHPFTNNIMARAFTNTSYNMENHSTNTNTIMDTTTPTMSRGLLSLGILDSVFKEVWWGDYNYHLYRRSYDWAN